MNKFLATLVIAIAVISAVNAQCPTIVNRAGWGSRQTGSWVLPVRPAPYWVVHHTAGAQCNDQASCSQQMRNIQNFHMDGNGWGDIGYSWCVGGDGRAYEGRGWGSQGAHAPGFNTQSVGQCFFGLFTSVLPPVVARNAAQQLIQCGIQLGHVSASYWLIGHRQGSATECPGQALFNDIQGWPRWTSTPRPI